MVVGVDNPEFKLMPGMTAYVNITIAQRQNVLMVPNAALRFRPADAPSRAAKPGGGQNNPQDERNRQKADTTPMGTVYVLESAQIKPVRVSVGITDSRNTEITGDEIKEGTAVIIEDRQPPEKTKSGSGMRLF